MDKIMKAVNDLRGDRFVRGKHEYHHTHIANNQLTGRFYSAYLGDIINSDTEAVCTIKQFNDLVSQLETNFGTSCTRKESLTALEVASCLSIGSNTDFPIELKQAKPVYTQAMKDSGELPQVGTKCCYSSLAGIVWNECTIIAYHDGFVWTSDNGIRRVANTIFKPIDTRTPKQKAIDKLLNDMLPLYELRKDDDDYLTYDDTQIGAEYVIENIEKYGFKWVGE